MGYNYLSLKSIVENKNIFENKKVLTLGVLFPYVSNDKYIAELSKNHGIDVTRPLEEFSKHIFCEVCGAKSCDALDVSEYQGAKLICNLNLPLSQEHYEQYDVVIDAGTLEHLSNTPVAINNIFMLLGENGIYYFANPCNGWVDHGFFQFSPTFYKDLTFDNDKLIELVNLNLAEGTSKLDVMKIENLRLTSFVTSHKKLNVSGIIRKVSRGEIKFDFIQAKYREWHNRDSKAVIKNKNILKEALVNIFIGVCQSVVVPYRVKDALLKLVGR